MHCKEPKAGAALFNLVKHWRRTCEQYGHHVLEYTMTALSLFFCLTLSTIDADVATPRTLAAGPWFTAPA